MGKTNKSKDGKTASRQAARKTPPGKTVQRKNAAINRRGSRPARVLWLLFGIGVLLRFLLAVTCRPFVSIGPDEPLYLNIAKSLWQEGEILLRGQPTNYAYLLYPMLLSPIYALLPASVDLMTVVQFVNSCLMCSVVFPAYYAAREITGDGKRAYTVAFMALLLPELAYSASYMSESLIYALFFAAFYVSVLIVKRKNTVYFALLGVLGALMYYTKNFHALYAVVFLLLAIVFALIQKDRRALLGAALGLAVFAVLFVGFKHLTTYAFHLVAPTYTINTAADVAKGVAKMAGNIGLYAEGFVMYAAFFTVVSGGALLAVPAFSLRKYSTDNRKIALTVGGALVCILLAAVYAIFPTMRKGAFLARIDLRYITMYVVPLLALSLTKEVEGKRLSIFGAAWLALTALYLVLFRFSSGFTSEGLNSLTLSVFTPSMIGDTASGVMSFIVAAALILLAYFLWKKGWKRSLSRTVLCTLAFVFLLSNVLTYSDFEKNSESNTHADAYELAQKFPDMNEEILMISKEHFSFENMTLDAHMNNILAIVPLNEFNDSLIDNDGVYVPFIPEASHYRFPDRTLPDTANLVFMRSSIPLYEFAPSVALETTSKGMYTLARIVPGEQCLTSLLTNLTLNRDIPDGGNHALLTVFADTDGHETDLIALTFRLNTPKSGANLTIRADGGALSVPLEPGISSVSASVPSAGAYPRKIYLTSDTAGVRVLEYATTGE